MIKNNNKKKTGLPLASDSTGNRINSTPKVIEIALGFTSCYFNYVTHTTSDVLEHKGQRACAQTKHFRSIY